jgi:glycosyltransferase involved in cell wall biosynthesis
MIIALDARPLIRSRIQGAEQRARNILAAWARNSPEHQFHLIYPRPTAEDPLDESLLSTLPTNFVRVEISNYTLPSSFHSGMRFLNTLARAIGRIQPDVYHSFTPDVPRIGTCPVVPTVHDLSFELDPVVRRTAEGREMRRIASQGAKIAKRVVTVSAQTKSDLASVYHVDPNTIDVIYNGIDAAFTPPPPTEMLLPKEIHLANGIKSPYVLAVGADIPRRNYGRMLMAMRMVWATAAGRRAQWVLAGRESWEATAIYASAKEAGVLDKMRFVQAPSNEQLADLYRNATLTCCASSFEGFGLSVLESLACGTAVACSDMHSLREVAEEAAVYFAHDDAQAMGETIAGLLEDAEYRRQLKYRGLRRVNLFTWSMAAQLTLASLSAATEK